MTIFELLQSVLSLRHDYLSYQGISGTPGFGPHIWEGGTSCSHRCHFSVVLGLTYVGERSATGSCHNP